MDLTVFYEKHSRKMMERVLKRKKIIDPHRFTGYTFIGKERRERLNTHRNLLGNRFSPTSEYQKLQFILGVSFLRNCSLFLFGNY
jgi:hypothetical protein